MNAEPNVSYWHLWTDADGVSRQSLCALSEFEMQSISQPADPQWLGRKQTGQMTTLVTVLPVEWIGTWHENPHPQWIIPLSGRWFVESMDGARVEMGPGELSFGGDQNCQESDGKVGHRSGTVGSEPAVLMIVQLQNATAHIAPCEFR